MEKFTKKSNLFKQETNLLFDETFFDEISTIKFSNGTTCRTFSTSIKTSVHFLRSNVKKKEKLEEVKTIRKKNITLPQLLKSDDLNINETG